MYEYKIVRVTPSEYIASDEDVERDLNDYAKDGWRVIHAFGGTTFLLERIMSIPMSHAECMEQDARGRSSDRLQVRHTEAVDVNTGTITGVKIGSIGAACHFDEQA